ncbi:MAG: hypothetical protein ACKVX7_13045 [Planctomycetota bacterium]
MLKTERARGAIALFALALAGCAGPLGPRQPVAPPRPAPAPKTIDYRQEALKDIDATTSIEKILELYPPPPPPAARPAEPVATYDARATVSEDARRNHPRAWRHEDYCDNEWCDHYGHHRGHNRHHRDGINLGRTLLYGTVGGIIGHQSGHRDEGILWGVGLGLLEDVLGGW